MRRTPLLIVAALSASAAYAQNISPWRIVPGTGGTITVAPHIVGSTVTPAGTYVAQISALPNVLVSLDPAVPATTSPISGTAPAMQVDSNGNVLALQSADGNTYNAGYGRATLLTTGGPNGKAAFHDVSSNSGGGYEAFNIPLATSTTLELAGQAQDVFFVMRKLNPGGNALIRYQAGNNGLAIFGAQGASDCAMRLEDNRGSAIGSEPSGAATACGQWQVVEFPIIGGSSGSLSILRNGVATFTTPSGPVAGYVPSIAQIANDCECDIAYAEVTSGIGTLVQRNAELTRLAALYGISGTTPITAGPNAGIAPVVPPPPDPTIADVLLTLNHQTAALPVASGTVLGSGLSMTGFTPIIGARFGTATGQIDGAGIRPLFEMNYNGATQAIGAPGDTGQSPGNSPFHAVARHYPLGSPNDLIPVMADGVHMRAVCSQAGNTDCSSGNVWGMLLRDPTAGFMPGKTAKFRVKKPKGDHSWNPLWWFSHDGGSGGWPIEIDQDDNFSRFGQGTATGYQIDFGTPNIYGAKVPLAPYTLFSATGGGYVYHFSGPNYSEVPFDWSADFHDTILSWDHDSEVMSLIVDGKLISQAYHPFAKICSKDSNGNCIGLDALIGNQAIPTFSPNSGTAINNDGITDGWTMVMQEYDMFQGAFTPAQAQALIPAGTTNATPVLFTNGPTPPSGQHSLTNNDHGNSFVAAAAGQTIGSNPFSVTATVAFTSADIANGAMVMGRWGDYYDEWRARITPAGKMEVCWYGVATSGPTLSYNDSHVCIQSSASFAPQANAFYDLEWDANPGAGTATFYAQRSGGTKTQLGTANVATKIDYYNGSASVATVPMTVGLLVGIDAHIGQGNNDGVPNPAPDGSNAFRGSWTKAALLVNGTPVLAPVVGASSITDASAGTPAWTAMTTALGGSAVFDSYTQPGGPAVTPPPPPTVPTGTEAVTASLGGASFRNFGILSGSTVSQATSGSSPVVVTTPMQPADAFQGVMTPAAAGPGTWTATLTAAGPGGAGSSGPLYSTGLLLGQAGATLPSFAQSFAYNGHSYDGLWTPSLGFGFGGDQPFNSLGQAYCIRAVRDASNWTFLGAGAPCAAGSFVQFAQTPLASLGTVDSIGVFSDPVGNGVSNAVGGVTMSGWSYSAGANPQAAGP